MTVEPQTRRSINEFVNSSESVDRVLASTCDGFPAAAALSGGLREELGRAADDGFGRRYARNTVCRTMTRLGFVERQRYVPVNEPGSMVPKADVYRWTGTVPADPRPAALPPTVVGQMRARRGASADPPGARAERGEKAQPHCPLAKRARPTSAPRSPSRRVRWPRAGPERGAGLIG